MTYIILAAGKGNNLQPLTLKNPKTSYKLDSETTIIQRLVRKIRQYDKHSEIVVVLGYLANQIKKELQDENVHFVINPFYEVTNSIASVWFARNYLERENVTILHGDVVFDDYIMKNYITEYSEYPYVLVDKTKSSYGTYNAVIKENKILVMSKKLEKYDAKYGCMSKLDAVSSRLVKQKIDDLILANMYDQYFEDTLVQMVMFDEFELYCEDISKYKWNEIDTVDDLINAQIIHNKLKI